MKRSQISLTDDMMDTVEFAASKSRLIMVHNLS